LDHGLHVLKPQSFLPNCAPKTAGKTSIVLWITAREFKKFQKFQHPVIQTKIEQQFVGFFHQ
jgi:hypothetical protein